jgi:hypothetical protein
MGTRALTFLGMVRRAEKPSSDRDRQRWFSEVPRVGCVRVKSLGACARASQSGGKVHDFKHRTLWLTCGSLRRIAVR